MSDVNNNQGTWAEPSQFSAGNEYSGAQQSSADMTDNTAGTPASGTGTPASGTGIPASGTGTPASATDASASAAGAFTGQPAPAFVNGTAAPQSAPPAFGAAQAPYPVVVQNRPRHMDTEETKRLKENFFQRSVYRK